MNDYEKELWRNAALEATKGAASGNMHPHAAARRAAEIADHLVLEYRVRRDEGITS